MFFIVSCRITSFFFFNLTRREHAVRSLLCRHCSLSVDHTYVEKERFMLDDLKIPAEWIHEAKVGLGKLGYAFFGNKR